MSCMICFSVQGLVPWPVRRTLCSHPNIPAPDCTAYEVGVVVGDSEVVDGGDFIGAVDGVDLDEFAVVGDQVVARFDLSGGDEVVLRRDVERVLDRRLDRSAPNDQLHHHRRPNKLLLNPLQLQRTSRIKLAASKHQIAHFQFVDRTAIAVKVNDNRRSRRKASDGKVRHRAAERRTQERAVCPAKPIPDENRRTCLAPAKCFLPASAV
jgi:hypothetical protein